MKRADIVTVVPGYGLGNKPRPAVIVQADEFDETISIALCPFTSDEIDAPRLRIPIEPTPGNGLRARSWIMVDKIVAVYRSKVGKPIGRLSEGDFARFERALVVFLGLAG